MLLTISGIIIITVIVLIAFISPITKYLIEKYDVKYTGRQIKIGTPFVNPFSGYMYFSNFRVYESNSDSVFISVKGLTINFNLLKMLSKTYEISELSLASPQCVFIQNKKDFNFNDLIEKFTPENSDTTLPPVHFNLLRFKIEDGVFHYHEKEIPINYFIKKVNIDCSGMRWDTDTVAAKFSFTSGIGGGDIKGDFTVNLKTDNYRIATVVNKFDLQIIEQYLKDLSNYGTFRAHLDADIRATGNLDNPDHLNAKGRLEINDFHFGKNRTTDYGSFDKLVVRIDQLSPAQYKYLYDSVILSHPYFKYEMYDSLDNLETMFGKNGSNIQAVKADPDKFNLIIEIADYVKEITKNFFQSYYKINTLIVDKGDLKFYDYSMSEKFSMAANPFFILADSIDTNHRRPQINFKSSIEPYGDLAVTLKINPKDSGDFDMQFQLQKISAAMFNPYVISSTSYPLDRGTIELNGLWKVRNGEIKSENHLVIIDPRLTKRIKNKDAKRLPLPLIMAFIRESENVIDYEIPITGNLKNPHFHLHDIIFDLLKNIFVKPVLTPYRMQVQHAENEIEKSLTFKWQMNQFSLSSGQEKFVEKMTDFLSENPEASIAIYPYNYALKEKEYILFFEAKKRYFLQSELNNGPILSEEDSDEVNKMSIKDSAFIHYLMRHAKDSLQFTVQEKCSNLIKESVVNNKYKQLIKERENAFIFFFKQKGVENRVKIYPGENSIPYNGFSFYKIEYKGDIPESLRKSYQKMNELNDERPRKKYKKVREKNPDAKLSIGSVLLPDHR